MVVLRPARIEDCERVWQWNFAPDVRARSRTQDVVAFADHEQWFKRRLERRAIWIIEDATGDVGVVRIDDGRISIALEPRARGRGVARRAIQAACAAWGAGVYAEILIDNIASRRCFEASGFRCEHESDGLAHYRLGEAA